MGQQEVCVRGRTKVLYPSGPGTRAAWLLTTKPPLQPISAHFYCYLPFAWASSSHPSLAWQKTMWLSLGSSKNSFPARDSPPCRWNSVHSILPPTCSASHHDGCHARFNCHAMNSFLVAYQLSAKEGGVATFCSQNLPARDRRNIGSYSLKVFLNEIHPPKPHASI